MCMLIKVELQEHPQLQTDFKGIHATKVYA